ncbi:MAG: YkvA family protein [Acidimicrobiia bacterium]
MTEEPKKVHPDEVLPPEGASIQSRKLITDAAKLVPNLVKLVIRLIKDPRVPRRSKIALGLALAYVASPIDIIPEIVPVLGWADDLLLLMLTIDSLIERAGKEVVEEHWDGPVDLLGMMREVIAAARMILPKRITMVIDRLSG